MIYFAYLRYLVRHKWFVFWQCRRFKVSLWRAVKHDWSKFMPCEFFPYARKFYGGYPPGNIFISGAFDKAWNHHIHLNDHHWEHHVLVRGGNKTTVMRMLEMQVREMVADWHGTAQSRGLAADTTPGWYLNNREAMALHPATRSRVEVLLGVKDRLPEVTKVAQPKAREIGQ